MSKQSHNLWLDSTDMIFIIHVSLKIKQYQLWLVTEWMNNPSAPDLL